MYFPILRGKQFELLALRDLAPRLEGHLFSPVIEPVRSNFSSLSKTIKLLNDEGIQPVVIVNPYLGEFSNLGSDELILEELISSTDDRIEFLPCLNNKGLDTKKVAHLVEKLDNFAIFIDGDFDKELLPILKDAEFVFAHRYRRSFKELKKVVIVKDGFDKKTKNSEYDNRSFFSDLHYDYSSFGGNVVGFGDYTITGRQYSESGGPAYVVTVHLSYIDSSKDDDMYVRHFKSYDDNSPTQPGEKFGNALAKLVAFVDDNEELFYETLALDEFYRLNEEDHFPGLGSVKKLSISHHIETISMYLSSESDE